MSKALALTLLMMMLPLCAPGRAAPQKQEKKTACQAPGDPAPDFEFTDQYGDAHARDDYAGLPVVLVYAGRDSSERSRALGQSLRARYNVAPGGEPVLRLHIVPVAHLAAVPPPMREVALKFILEMSEKNQLPPMLLDWDGFLDKQFGFTPGATNAYALDASGRVAACAVLKKKSDYNALFSALDALVAPEKK